MKAAKGMTPDSANSQAAAVGFDTSQRALRSSFLSEVSDFNSATDDSWIQTPVSEFVNVVGGSPFPASLFRRFLEISFSLCSIERKSPEGRLDSRLRTVAFENLSMMSEGDAALLSWSTKLKRGAIC